MKYLRYASLKTNDSEAEMKEIHRFPLRLSEIAALGDGALFLFLFC